MISWMYRTALLALSFGACAAQYDVASAPPREVLELSLARADGRRIPLSALDGQPRLLFMFATYDDASQFALVPLSRFLEQHPNTQVLGVLLQPEAQTFIPLFARSLSVPFELFAEPDNRVLHGSTPLGKLAGVPAFVVVDAQGVIRDLRYGVMSEADLAAMLDRAR